MRNEGVAREEKRGMAKRSRTPWPSTRPALGVEGAKPIADVDGAEHQEPPSALVEITYTIHLEAMMMQARSIFHLLPSLTNT
jgi:hypothetical protein